MNQTMMQFLRRKKGKKMLSFYSNITERAIENKVFKKLELLGYITEMNNPNQDVFTQKPKSHEEFKKLKNHKPDFIIYDNNTPIAIIETKKPNSNLKLAEKQAEAYAKNLNVKIIFTFDGYRLFSKHLTYNQELKYGNTPLKDFVNKKTLKEFINNYKIDFNFGKKIHSENSFIKELKNIEDLLWTTGLRKGDERFTEFCKILFLRLIEEKEPHTSWNSIVNSHDDKQKIHIINGHLKDLNQKYKMGKYGEALKLNPEYHYHVVSEIITRLNQIDFKNTSLDVKGNAFEFFLGYRGTSDDLAQYFTPRNIIRFMCDLTEPKPGEKIYDPFCGSGGILINAFEYIKKQIDPQDDEQLKILKKDSIYGTDINNIAYVAKMNMILVGDGHANITQQQDGSLINKRTAHYDIVMTNIPFNLSINRYKNNVHALYDVFSENGNAICVQHCLDSLKKNSSPRACIIVPEQFIFHKSFKETRKYIIEQYDVKIFSLPQGVFEPYTNVKTCILYLEYKGQKREFRIY
ncbi:hypothetical protein HPP_4570 [Hydrangea phyllody phytoplasma]|uniref:site-specific DNA-methyltransferase (adenine-specific) n=2 Tax=16SrI (Aster yellows group) TaxID=3042590 RepID=A0ABQ5PSM9_9MOLU|nr:N-6 DNA methylase [Hydrangea phyllody phytoplasma]GFZ75499.1 hypothetical protein HPP_4570 [Hydrangea phyllody phytoplasma]GLH61249.1 hypothetical protein RHYP_1940 [Rhus yellows phytoplasma]GLH62024.1 hypothetical protein HP2P_4310 [Hydrangea phyllody phytoplasma]GLH62137.1 hypothetical protein HP2P_5440 [Hydrangea phyllody phytoplasma]